MSANRHTLDLATGENIRELGGYPVVDGGLTQTHRFLRSGDTSELSRADLHKIRRYGVSRVVDLRGDNECHTRPDPFARKLGVSYLQTPLYDLDMHDPKLVHPTSDEDGLADYLIRGYIDILANKPQIKRAFDFFAKARPKECVLYHCTAGMDRTGVMSMLLLALAGVGRAHIVADYAYSFADESEVDARVFGPAGEATAQGEHPELTWDDAYRDALAVAPLVMGTLYDRLCEAYGDVPSYLHSCGLSNATLESVRSHLLA